MKPVGLTKDAGWEIGVRRTFELAPETAWNKFFSRKGISAWLGEPNVPYSKWVKGSELETQNGISITINVLKPYSHIRMKWKMADWKQESFLQIRIIPSKTGTVVSFHHEKLSNASQRKEMKAHWEKVLEDLQKVLT